jgi:alkaline phosphatase D
LQNRSKIIGVWDDHDFGVNNGDFTYKGKYIQREIYLDFIGEPSDSLRRLEKQRGIYQDYITYMGDLKVHIVLLDVRFHYN